MLIQREGRPALDLTPDATPSTAGWDERYDDPANDRNKPVPERKGAAEPNGWVNDAFDTNQTDEV